MEAERELQRDAGMLTASCRLRRTLWLGLTTLMALPTAAGATTIEAPVGGAPFCLPGKAVLCQPAPDGWTWDPVHATLRPPADEAVVGKPLAIQFASSPDACAVKPATAVLLATAPWPHLDAASVQVAVDEGRIELRGKRLRGLQLVWQAGNHSGWDQCLEPRTDGSGTWERCTLAGARGAAADTTAIALAWLPAGARRDGDADITIFDAGGLAAAPERFALRPARVLVSSVIQPGAAADLSDGSGKIPLTHPEAVAAVDCGAVRCDLTDGSVMVRSVPGAATSIDVRFRMAPHVALLRGEAQDPSPSSVLAILHCPVSIASGDALRDVEDTRVVVRLDARCGREARSLRWTANGDPAQVDRVQTEHDGVFVVLRVGRLEDDVLSIVATRPDPDPSVVAVVTGKTRPAPRPRFTLEFPGFGPIDFIPRNRAAELRVAAIGKAERLVPLPVEGAYSILAEGATTRIRADQDASGFASLRFGFRIAGLPPTLADLNMAVLGDPLQLPIREASLPAPIGATALSDHPIVELACNDRDGHPQPLLPGATRSIPFASRDSCHVTVHRGRLRSDDGPQELNLEIEVTSVDGTARSDAGLSERMVLRPGPEDRVIWIRGVKQPFDKISIRVSHVMDEARYLRSTGSNKAPPVAQWNVVVGTERLRLYLTAAIPTGLYRLSDKATGQLTLNFGVLSRITWLDRQGHDGLVNLELGLMGVNLVGTSETPDIGHPISALMGVGLSVPIGNRGQKGEASFNLHAWVEYEFRDSSVSRRSPTDPKYAGSPWGFVFGPSLTIGNIGANL